MSGGPVFDKCGDFVGINTMATSDTSLIISGGTLDTAKFATKEEPKKIKLEPGSSPTSSVYACYYLLKARDTQGCYDLLSPYYKTKSTYAEWTTRFPDVIGVSVFITRMNGGSLGTVFVKFGTTNWNDNDVKKYLYEGTWKTILEDGKYKMLKSNIKEIFDPARSWFYE